MKRRSPLVSQFLEKASWKVLRDYPEIIRGYIRRRHGVYALYRKARLYYVGLANNLRGGSNSTCATATRGCGTVSAST